MFLFVQAVRERRLLAIRNNHVEVIRATNTEASYGAALLAAAPFTNERSPIPIQPDIWLQIVGIISKRTYIL